MVTTRRQARQLAKKDTSHKKKTGGSKSIRKNEKNGTRLNARQKATFRMGYCMAKNAGIKYTHQAKVKDLERVSNLSLSRNPEEFRELISEGRKFVQKCYRDAFTVLKWKENAEKVLTTEEVKAAKDFLNKVIEERTNAGLVESTSEYTKGAEISRAEMFNISQSKNAIIERMKQVALDAVEDKLKNWGSNADGEWNYSEFKRLRKEGRIPLSVRFNKYRPGQQDGMSMHTDCYVLFAAAVIVIEETQVGNLEVPILKIDGPVEEGTMVLLSPHTLHAVQHADREKNRIAVIVSM